MDRINSALYIEDGELRQYAAANARVLHPTGECSGAAAARALRWDYRDIRRCHEQALNRYGQLSTAPAEWEWLLDNFYMVQREYQAVFRSLDRAKRLRSCCDGLMVAALCRNLVISGRGSITEERLSAFLEGFQTVTVLKRAELELLPAALSAAVIAGLASLCRSLVSGSPVAEPQLAFEALFGSLRLFAVLDMEKLLDKANVTNGILASELSGDYGRMDSGTKREYLRRVEKLARREGSQEHEFAARLVKKARERGCHVGFFLFGERGSGAESLYIGSNVLMTFFISILVAFMSRSPLTAFLLLLPVSELIKSLMDFVLLHLVPSRRLFRMDVSEGLPPEGRTICVISSLLGSEADAGRLEELYHACKGEREGLLFGLLADLPAADSPSLPRDGEMLARAREDIESLNRRYGSFFYLFTRERSYDGEKYSPRERKRGAIMELARLICDKPSRLKITGDRDALAGIRYIVTLDSDTRIYPGSVGELIGAMLHPLNRPEIDEKLRRVRRGHALIHPRIDTELKSAVETDFSIIFSGGGGSDPYGSLCGELYMDAFGSGGFAGKGIIDAAALIKCTSHFPEGRVLSHDAPEGAYLRGAYMGDVEFSDRFPSKPLSYYKRQHRWIRGDWQNLPFIFAPGLRYIDRWRLFDSLRRSLIAPATLAAILTGFYASSVDAAAWAALLALLSRLFLAMAEGAVRRRGRAQQRRYTRILSGAGAAIVQTFIRLWLLPFEAWVSLTAIVTALWRMLVSHKKLLQWQTAAQSQSGAGLAEHIRAMLFPLFLGLGLMLSCPLVIGKASGLMWLLSPAAAAALALDARRETQLSGSERDYLQKAARLSYKYLENFHHRQNNFLPPDNFQEQPPVGLAQRSSPTNMGLAMVSDLAAYDMGFISKEKLEESLSETLTGLESLPRSRGHFYNWYDIRSLRPLQPAYISTVDSGNLCAALITVRAGAAGLAMEGIERRVGAILDKMDFSFLYDRRRELFHICYDPVKDRGVGGWYDLMASEAMLTSYVAVARGDVPVRHWRRLSRAQLQKDGYRGLASWTGTMFEYLMPSLFLPVYRGSLLYESQRFCVYAQKRRVWAGKPWGISESAFYSLDSALSYRYKAHGVAALALRRGQDAELVISPYSSFLALAIDPAGSVKNLRRLETMGAMGRFGFIEALDFSPARCRSDRGEQVRCYMAHHVGMSVIAAANALCQGSIQRRFMDDPAMNAHSLLLQERMEEGGVVIRRSCGDIPERLQRGETRRWLLRGNEQDRDEKCAVMSNGAYSIFFSNTGRSRAVCGGITVYDSAFGDDSGVGLSLSEEGGRASRLCALPPELWELGEDNCRISLETLGVRCGFGASVASGDWGELRSVSLSSPEDRELELCFSFCPILARHNDYVNHAAFWSLGIQAQTEGDMLLLSRLERGGCPQLWLAIVCSEPVVFEADRKGRGGNISQPFVRCHCQVMLRAGENRELRFALGLAHERQEAEKSARRILAEGDSDRGNMPGAAALHLGMQAEEIGAAMLLLKDIWQGQTVEAAARSELWSYGISGELPIICCDGRAVEAEALLRRFCLLKSCNVEADLVYLSDEQGEYRQPVFSKISGVLDSLGLGSLVGERGAVHFVPMSAAGLMIGRAVHAVGVRREPLPPPQLPEPGDGRRLSAVPEYRWTEKGFEFFVDNTLPSRVWQHIMSNGSFGYLATDCGMGGMWYENAREMPLNRPALLSHELKGSEFLWVERGERRISLFAANDGFPCRVEYGPGYALWEKTIDDRLIKTTAFVSEEENARVLMIEGALGMKLGWTLLPAMGPDPAALSISREGRALHARSADSYFADLLFTALCSRVCRTQCGTCPPSMHLTVIADEFTAIACGVCPMERLEELCTAALARERLASVKRAWSGLTERALIKSGCEKLDAYMNVWSVYQTVACRLLGRSSIYQSGGAIGFRDQLQDGVNMLFITPKYAKERIVDACRHQYREGDVMHWWHPHPKGDRGVRTRCSDDLLWLVWALCEYAEKTGDYALCREKQPYLCSPPLHKDERDRYETPERSAGTDSVLEHAVKALEMCIARGFGSHGLPFMGSGDWNDALDGVEGESVWLAWFMAHCADRLAALLKKLGEKNAVRYENLALRLYKDADRAWAGRWYYRAFFPDGEALGGSDRIDSIAQSWAVLCGMDPENKRARLAVDSALRSLVDRRNSTVKLFDPPYSPEDARVGYIASYGEGFRENGGQYSHGAVWLAMAALRLGRYDEGWDILSMLLPSAHEPGRYAAEPYVLAADVYSAGGREGEAGWTWYTGSAGWYFRAVYEEMLGLRQEEGKLRISPRLPSGFDGCTVYWTDGKDIRHEIRIDRRGVRVDGEAYTGGLIG